MQELLNRAELLQAQLIQEAKRMREYVSKEKQEAYKNLKQEQIDTINDLMVIVSQDPQEVKMFGKPMPQVQDLEMIVLGAILCDSAALSQVSEFLKPEHFYNKKHVELYALLIEMQAQRIPIDLVTVATEQKKKGIEDAYYLCFLTERVASSANISYHSKIIVQKFLQREIIQRCTETIKAAYDDTVDCFELMEQIQGIEPVNLARHKTAQQ
jgi:hypothetical protein